jgi:hypothetical protein
VAVEGSERIDAVVFGVDVGAGSRHEVLGTEATHCCAYYLNRPIMWRPSVSLQDPKGYSENVDMR